ncbi:MAG: NYN domain-containing protein [Betaproteobacteria bacterium AqS2]|uniref:NYN domain-containing protein n=1 Tax=Candidatus Amphirhobacter heronislandensis TaxID=1732024 RepID=A0A930UFM9_9GAMM|nr:NYN domain-containing protein [Betaproteobacteria bacterium AqS2]
MGLVFFYVDGHNLYHGAGEGRRWLSLPLLASLILGKLGGELEVAKIHYFTSEYSTKGKAGPKQQTYLRVLAQHKPLVEVHLGRFEPKKRTCNSCNHEQTRPEEKETDVSIGCQMLHDVYNNKHFHTAVLLSGDGDFVPAIRFVDKAKKRAVVLNPRGKNYWRFQEIAPESFPLLPEMYDECLLPDRVKDGEGFLVRPKEW